MPRRSNTKPDPNRGLVAAARRIPTMRTDGKPAVRLPRSEWQTDAWEYFEVVPEVKHSTRYVGNAMAKLVLYPAIANPDPEGDPIPVADEASGIPEAIAARLTAELERLKSDRGGQSEIQRQLAQNIEVAGECYLIGLAERQIMVPDITGIEIPVTEPEKWEIHSIAEVIDFEQGYAIKGSPNDQKPRKLTSDDTLIRIWQRHPQWAEQPDCGLAGCLIDCEALHTLSLLVIGDSNSKRNNGFLLVPNEITFSSPNQTKDGTQDELDEDEDDDPVFRVLGETVQGPIADPASASAVQPTLVRGPASALKEFRHVLAMRPNDATLDTKIEGRVRRIARGLDLPVEVVLGLESTTFANAAQVDQDTFDDYLEPRANFQSDALSWGFYAPQLRSVPDLADYADGMNGKPRVFIYYDASKLITQPDRSETATELYDKLELSGAAYRKAKGWGEDDKPTPLELLWRAGLKRGIMTGDITMALLRKGGEPIELLPLPVAPPAAEGDPTVADAPEPTDAVDDEMAMRVLSALYERDDLDPELRDLFDQAAASLSAPRPRRALTAASGARRPSNAGGRLLAIDQDLRTRLTIAANAAMTHALERAGNKLRNKSTRLVQRDTLAGVPSHLVAAKLGRALVADAAIDPLDGAWDELEDQFRTWGAAAQAQAIDVAGQITSGFTVGEREALQLRQAADLDEAWTWMKSSLTTLADERMFTPDPSGPDLGEFDPTVNVPTGLVRQAMARAGGATGLATDGRSAWVAVYPNGDPVGMIATGELLMGALSDNGAEVEGYTWVYGPGQRTPFPPHADLDGVQFVNFDDDVLINSEGWPDSHCYPGDHGGCQCDYEPTILVP